MVPPNRIDKILENQARLEQKLDAIAESLRVHYQRTNPMWISLNPHHSYEETVLETTFGEWKNPKE